MHEQTGQKIHFLQKEIDLLKKNMEHNFRHSTSEIKKLRHEHDSQVKLMQSKSPYDMLPNALKPEQIDKWKKYYEDYSKFKTCCDKAGDKVQVPNTATPSTTAV